MSGYQRLAKLEFERRDGFACSGPVLVLGATTTSRSTCDPRCHGAQTTLERNGKRARLE